MKSKTAILLLALIGASAQAGNMQITGRVINSGLPLPPGIHAGDAIHAIVTFRTGQCVGYNCGEVNAINVRVGEQSLHGNGGLISWRIGQNGFYAVGDSAVFSALYDSVNNYIFIIFSGGYAVEGQFARVPSVH